MPSSWGEFTSLLSSSINESIKTNPQVSRSSPRGLLGSVTLTAIVLGWCRWGWACGVGWSYSWISTLIRHFQKAGEIIVATKQLRFKCVSVILSVSCARFLF